MELMRACASDVYTSFAFDATLVAIPEFTYPVFKAFNNEFISIRKYLIIKYRLKWG